MAVSVAYAFNMTVTETLEAGVPGAENPRIVHSGYNESGTINSASTPPATKHAQFLQALTAGAATINLAALIGTNGATVDGTGLRLQMIRVKNLGANSMTFSEGASNGIAAGCLPFTVPAGGIVQFYLNDASPDIASGDRTIDIAGTTTQTAEISIVMG